MSRINYFSISVCIKQQGVEQFSGFKLPVKTTTYHDFPSSVTLENIVRKLVKSRLKLVNYCGISPKLVSQAQLLDEFRCPESQIIDLDSFQHDLTC